MAAFQGVGASRGIRVRFFFAPRLISLLACSIINGINNDFNIDYKSNITCKEERVAM